MNTIKWITSKYHIEKSDNESKQKIKITNFKYKQIKMRAKV